MTLEAEGAEPKPGQAMEKGKTLGESSLVDPRNGDRTRSALGWPVQGVSRRAGEGGFGRHFEFCGMQTVSLVWGLLDRIAHSDIHLS